MNTLLLFLFLLSVPSATSQTPHNLLQHFSKSHIDWKVAPCDDFFRHVCPEGSNLNGEITAISANIIDAKHSKYLVGDSGNKAEIGHRRDRLVNFLKRSDADVLCRSNHEIFAKLARIIVNLPTVDWNRLPCYWLMKEVRKSNFLFYQSQLDFLVVSWFQMMINDELAQAEDRTRRLFDELIVEIGEEFKKTPWVLNKNAVDLYLSVLNKQYMVTIFDFREALQNALDEWNRSWISCERELHDVTSSEFVAGICQAVALSDARRVANFELDFESKFPGVPPKNREEFIRDVFSNKESFIYKDTAIIIANSDLMLANTDYASDLYGGLGAVMLHEFMHPFVFHENDSNVSSLKDLWTNCSDCVKKQAEKTCETFPIPYYECPPTNSTFKHDAIGLTAYRIAWKVYERKLSRKIRNAREYEKLDEKQLFFYSLASRFCGKIPTAFSRKEKRSNYHHRINSLMSQMDQFSDVFKCKQSDRMARNKAEHCELYGENAPETKMLMI